MTARHRKFSAHLPTVWLFTDERVSDETLLASIARLPRGSGIIFRHYTRDHVERRQLFDAVRAVARRRGLTLLLAGDAALALRWRADGWHGAFLRRPANPRALMHSMPVHTLRELAVARRNADLAFVSPVFPTRSHPGAPAVGPARFATFSRHATIPVMALGGMNARRAQTLARLGASGWGAIDALTGG